MTASMIVTALLLPACAVAFVGPTSPSFRHTFLRMSSETDADKISALMNPTVAGKFKILTCSSTSCAKRRKECGMDDFETYGQFYNRIQEHAPQVQLEESPCLGSCKMAPCVAIEHEDYEGTVALEGMTDNEFTERVFHSVITEDDAHRVWKCVENAIKLMAEEEDEECGHDD